MVLCSGVVRNVGFPGQGYHSRKGDGFPRDGQRTGNKRQTQEVEDEGEGEGKQKKGAGTFVPEETDMAHRTMVVYKGKRNPHVRMRC